MLTIFGKRHGHGNYCDGVSRRDFLTIGGSLLGGLSLADILRAERSVGLKHSHRAIINVYLPGGPPHLDMFDLKPEAPSEIRGEFKPIHISRRISPSHVVTFDDVYPSLGKGELLASMNNPRWSQPWAMADAHSFRAVA